MSRKSPLPALTLVEKKGSIYGRVRWRGEERWLGRASEQMHLEFARLRAYVAEHGRLPPREPDANNTSERLTVGDLCDLYEQHVAAYYRKDGEATSEVGVQQLALGYLRARAAAMPAPAFGPLALADCREAMVANDVSRRVVNGFVNRIRACFRWAVAQQLVPPTVLEGLRALDPLKKGRSAARETTPITAVSAETVHQVTPHVSRQVAAMMLLQLHTGMRPQEVRLLRWSEIDRSETKRCTPSPR